MSKPIDGKAKKSRLNRVVDLIALITASTVILIAVVGVLVFPSLLLGIDVLGMKILLIVWAFGLGMVVLWLPGMVIHELGHVVAAVAVGWRVQQFQIWPVALIRKGNHFVLRLHWSPKPPTTFVFALPPDGRQMVRHASVFQAGGVLANLLVALICLFALLFPLSEVTRFAGIAKIVLVVFLAVNLFIFVANLLPFRWQGMPNDGMKLVGLLKGGSGPLLFGVPAFLAESLKGARPRDSDVEVLDRFPGVSVDPHENAYAGLCDYYHALDSGQLERAGQLLEQALAWVEPLKLGDRSPILLEAAYFEGFHRRNAVVARKWLHQMEMKTVEEHTFLRGAAAVLFAEGLFAEAAASAESALARVGRSFVPGLAKAETDWLQAIIDECRHHLRQQESL